MTKEKIEKDLVKALAKRMQVKMDERSERYERLGWRKKPIKTLRKWLQAEVNELNYALDHRPPEEIASEVADVALLAMFIGDRKAQ